MNQKDFVSKDTKVEIGLLVWRETKDGCQFAEESIHIPGVCQEEEKEQPFPHQILCPCTSTLHSNTLSASTSQRLSVHELGSAWESIATTNANLNLYSYLLNYPHSEKLLIKEISLNISALFKEKLPLSFESLSHYVYATS